MKVAKIYNKAGTEVADELLRMAFVYMLDNGTNR
jgi:hypothetical protein